MITFIWSPDALCIVAIVKIVMNEYQTYEQKFFSHLIYPFLPSAKK